MGRNLLQPCVVCSPLPQARAARCRPGTGPLPDVPQTPPFAQPAGVVEGWQELQAILVSGFASLMATAGGPEGSAVANALREHDRWAPAALTRQAASVAAEQHEERAGSGLAVPGGTSGLAPPVRPGSCGYDQQGAKCQRWHFEACINLRWPGGAFPRVPVPWPCPHPCSWPPFRRLAHDMGAEPLLARLVKAQNEWLHEVQEQGPSHPIFQQIASAQLAG